MAPSLLRSPASARQGRTPSESIEEPRAWWVVAGAFVCTAVIFGVAYSFAAFFRSFGSEFGADRADISLVFGL